VRAIVVVLCCAVLYREQRVLWFRLWATVVLFNVTFIEQLAVHNKC
jgi:hypothetical protein